MSAEVRAILLDSTAEEGEGKGAFWKVSRNVWRSIRKEGGISHPRRKKKICCAAI